MLPALGIRLRQQRRWGRRHLCDRGDQGDHLALPVTVPVRDLVLDDPDVAGLVFVQVLPGTGRLDEPGPGLAADLRADQHRGIRSVRQDLQDRQREVGLDPPQQGRAGIIGRAPVRPVEEVPVGDQQPVLVQPAVELTGQRLLPGALARHRAHRRVRHHMRSTLADRDHPHLRERWPARVISPGASEPERGRVLSGIRGVPFEPVDRHQPPWSQERPGGQLLRNGRRHLGEQLFHGLVSQPLAGLGDPA